LSIQSLKYLDLSLRHITIRGHFASMQMKGKLEWQICLIMNLLKNSF